MSSDITDSRFYLRMAAKVAGCIRQDIGPIVLVAVALGLIGLVAGIRSNYATSTAQLLLTPLPLRAATTEDNLAKMIAEPLDVITASRLCTSDEALRVTMEKLNESGEFRRELDDLNRLRRALSFEVTVVKETPYETEYSPVLQLRARGRTAGEARLMVNSWADVSVELAERYRERQQNLAERAFTTQKVQLLESLSEAEGEIEAFLRENNLEFVEQRLEQLVDLTTRYLDLRAEIEQEVIDAKAKVAALNTILDTQEPAIRLRWTPSGRLTDWVGGQILTDETGEETGGDFLTQEQLNPVYTNILSEAAQIQGTIDGKVARLERLDEQLAEFAIEMREMQEEDARLKREDRRLERAAEIIEGAYMDAAVKANFARMANELDQPGIQLLSPGAEWRVPRFRRGILFGFAGGVAGFVGAAALSARLRLVVLPAVEASS